MRVNELMRRNPGSCWLCLFADRTGAQIQSLRATFTTGASESCGVQLRRRLTNMHASALGVIITVALAFSGQAHAANAINSVTLNGGSTTTVAPGATITVVVNNSGSSGWGSTLWYVGTTAPGTWNCDTGPSPSLTGNNQTYTFTITAPSTAGTYNAYFSTSSSGSSCTNNLSSTYTLTNSVIVTPPAPTATSVAATALTSTGATLNGTVSSNGAATTVTFDYGLTTAYGSTVTATPATLVAGASGTAVAATLTGLTCNTIYHFRVNGANSAGTTNGGDLTFATSYCAFACTPPSGAPSGVTCQCDTFARATLQPSTIFNSNWLVSTSDATGILPQIVNSGYLRLTNNTGNNAKAATVPGIFPAAGNYISVEFQQYAYNGTGADGIAVTLSDYSVPAVPGAYGGSLGFAQETGIHDGFAGGWLGVALDEYGNYQNPTEGRVGGQGFIVQSVGARGSGSGQTGYRWLGGTASLTPTIDDNTSTTRSLGYYYQVIVDARNDPTSTSIAVNRDTGGGYAPLITIPNVYTAATAQGFTQAPVPANWQISFTGSTGGSNNIHEIGNLRICATTMVPPSGGTAGGFNAIDEAYGTPPLAVQNYLNGHIYTKLLGTPFKLNVAALSNSQIVTTYAAGGAKTVTVKLVDNSDSLSDSTKDCTLSCTTTCTSKPAVTGGTQLLTFTAGAGQKGQQQSPASFTINTAYQKLVAIISDDTTSACSTDSFSVRPVSITISSNATNTAITGVPLFKAGGDNFILSATTPGVSGNPNGYTGVIKMIAQAASPATSTGALAATTPATAPAGTCPLGTPASTFPAATSATPSSTASCTFTYSEVGAFQLTGYSPDVACTVNGTPLTAAQCNLTQRGGYDDAWTGVDSISTKNDCVANSYSNIKDATGKYGCNFGLTTASVFGRFYPDHFDTVVISTLVTAPSGVVPMPCPTGLTCCPTGSTCPPVASYGFVYSGQPGQSGQPFVIQTIARNAAGSTTQNYQSPFAKAVALSTWDTLGGSTSACTTCLANGTLASTAFAAGAAATPTTLTPLTYTFATVPTAPTDIYVRATESGGDGVTSQRGTPLSSVEAAVKVVSGRVRISNSYGSERLPMMVPAIVQYWGGTSTGYVTSSTDNVDILNVTNVTRIICTGSLQTAGTCNTWGAINSVVSVPVTPLPNGYGVYSIKLSAPGAGNTGSETLSEVATWPAFLPGNSARATFGIYKGANEFIYQREAY